LARLLLVVIATLALAACGGASTTASTSPTTAASPSAEPTQSTTPLPTPTVAGTIAFVRAVEANVSYDIYAINVDGTGLRPLTETPDWEGHPSWSPDGSRIVYDVYLEGNGERANATVWVMNADGSGKVKLTKGAVVGGTPTWSPDGKQIVFMRCLLPSQRWAIFVMNSDGSGLKPVAEGSTDDYFPTWAPNGEILFLRLGDVFAVNPDGSGLMRLTKGGNVVNYALSPDGKYLAIQNATSHRIEVIPAHGGGSRVTLLNPVSDFIADPWAALAWTPDGKALILATSEFYGEHGSRLYIVNADGSGLSAVPGIDNADDPAWRPR
jgi:Tol biopolymer transport system component